MTYDDDNDLNDDDDMIDSDIEETITVKSGEEKNAKVRRRIDDLLESKRLKELLDDSEDW